MKKTVKRVQKMTDNTTVKNENSGCLGVSSTNRHFICNAEYIRNSDKVKFAEGYECDSNGNIALHHTSNDIDGQPTGRLKTIAFDYSWIKS